jgi:hypothetical protein
MHMLLNVMGSSTFQTSTHRVILAFLLGAAVGTTITTTQYLIGLYEVNGPEHFAEWWFSKGARVSMISYPVWLAFIVVFGGPVWLLLHRLKFLHWFAALISGAVVSSIVILAMATRMFSGQASGNLTYSGSGGQQWVDGVMTPFGWKIAFINAAEFGLIGSIVALAIRAVAYRRSKPHSGEE